MLIFFLILPVLVSQNKYVYFRGEAGALPNQQLAFPMCNMGLPPWIYICILLKFAALHLPPLEWNPEINPAHLIWEISMINVIAMITGGVFTPWQRWRSSKFNSKGGLNSEPMTLSMLINFVFRYTIIWAQTYSILSTKLLVLVGYYCIHVHSWSSSLCVKQFMNFILVIFRCQVFLQRSFIIFRVKPKCDGTVPCIL